MRAGAQENKKKSEKWVWEHVNVSRCPEKQEKAKKLGLGYKKFYPGPNIILITFLNKISAKFPDF